MTPGLQTWRAGSAPLTMLARPLLPRLCCWQQHADTLLSATLDFTGAGSSSAATAIPATVVGAATSLGGSAPVNISHQNAGPDPPQLYGSSWEHGSWGRNKAKRGQVRLVWFSGPPISPSLNQSSMAW